MRLQKSIAHKKMGENAVNHEYKKLCTYENCCFVELKKNSRRSIKGTRIREKNCNFIISCSSSSTSYKEIVNEIKNKCRSHKIARTSETLCKSQTRISQNVGDFLFNQRKEPATRKTKESKLNAKEMPYGSCRYCKRLQRPTPPSPPPPIQVTKISLSSFIFTPLIKMMLLLPSRSFRSTQIKSRKRQEIKSKSIMMMMMMIPFLVTIVRLLCILQITIPMVAAIELSQEQSQYTSPPFLTREQSSTALSPRIMSVVNRENILKQFQQKINFNGSRNATTTESTISHTMSPYLSCSSCQLRKAKNDSLESIKIHILSKLKLKEYPKMEVPRNVPENIIRDYYRKFDHNGRQRPIKSTLQIDSVDSQKGQQVNSKKVYSSHEDYMLSDDPNTFHEPEILRESNDDEDAVETDEEEYPRAKSTYVFPTSPRIRHSRKNDFLSFRFEKSDEMKITHTILHLYIRGREWIAEHEPDLSKRLDEDMKRNIAPEIVISVHLALRRANSVNYTHTVQVAESHHCIADGLGSWNEIDLKDLANSWEEGGDANQIIVVKTSEVWMRLFVVTGMKDIRNEITTNALTAYIEVRTEYRPGRHRNRRSTSMDCKESDKEERCCRYPLKVNFTSFGWSFVVAPTDFDAYFCNGECKLGFLEQNPHTHIASLSRSASPCCSPTKMSSLTLLYFNTEHNLVISTIPNMTVEKCSCS